LGQLYSGRHEIDFILVHGATNVMVGVVPITFSSPADCMNHVHFPGIIIVRHLADDGL
jgi:hypothetical protein